MGSMSAAYLPLILYPFPAHALFGRLFLSACADRSSIILRFVAPLHRHPGNVDAACVPGGSPNEPIVQFAAYFLLDINALCLIFA